MSVLDSFFNKGFKASKCKTLLKLTIPRIKLLRNRRELQIRQMRRDIAKLLETGQEATARIRVEHIIREENMMAAQEIIELYSELVSVRLPVIESQRECPLDLKEAISSICFAAPRCADLPELQQVQLSFASKYGKEFVAAATELMPDCGVNRQLIELLSVRAPSAEKKLKLLKEIAEEHEVDWDPAVSETELYKSHEDLLNGPTQFVSGSKMPLPGEKHEESLHKKSAQGCDELSDSDTGFDPLEFPEVPKAIPKPSAEVAPPSEAVVPPIPSAPSPKLDDMVRYSSLAHQPSRELGNKSETELNESPRSPGDADENKQFLPFISPPILPSMFRESSLSPTPFKTERRERPESNTKMDLHDVMVAAEAAAESAERAAAAARSAASLAQLKISELTDWTSGRSPENIDENPFHAQESNVSDVTGKPCSVRRISSGDSENMFNSQTSHVYEDDYVSGRSNFPTYDTPELETKYSAGDEVFRHDSKYPAGDEVFKQESKYFVGDEVPRLESMYSVSDEVFRQDSTPHQPQRLSSMDDDPYSYPNLFTSQGSNKFDGNSFKGNSHPTDSSN